MLTNEQIRSEFNLASPYNDYVRTAKPNELANWADFHGRVRLTQAQRSLIAGFVRRVNVLVVSGTWCGDCVQQCPMLDHIARANPQRIDVRFIDRDERSDFSARVAICGGVRVPAAIFMNEDFDFVSILGDRTLTRYRAMASRNLGPSCPLPGAPVPADEVAGTLQDWIDEFERVHLLLRLSPKLRGRHGD
ncbi:MAG: thioredoxin family protein [Phycisphaeraceae bacterium]|nr:thioredoxin family protein [Phycisphaeraceae bacterium]